MTRVRPPNWEGVVRQRGIRGAAAPLGVPVATLSRWYRDLAPNGRPRGRQSHHCPSYGAEDNAFYKRALTTNERGANQAPPNRGRAMLHTSGRRIGATGSLKDPGESDQVRKPANPRRGIDRGEYDPSQLYTSWLGGGRVDRKDFEQGFKPEGFGNGGHERGDRRTGRRSADGQRGAAGPVTVRSLATGEVLRVEPAYTAAQVRRIVRGGRRKWDSVA
jgi:hypothetical protein